MILPGMGVVSELITAFSRKKIFGYTFVAFSSLAIAVISFVVWGHHMFVTGQSIYAGLVFSVLSFLVAIPSAVKVFNWTATLYKGSISYEAPMLYALGFIGLFTIGGLTGLFLASLATDVHLNGTYFIVAHFHYVMVGGAVMAYLGGLHFWWPKITGRLYPGPLGALRRGDHFHRFQPDVLPAVRARLSGDAAALRDLSGGISGAQRDVVGGRFDPGHRLRDSADLFDLVDALRPAGGPESLGRQGSRVDDAFAAADGEFRGNPIVTEEATTTRITEVAQCLNWPLTARASAPGFAHQFEDIEQQREAGRLGMWVFLVTEILFFGGMFASYTIYRALHYPAFETGSHLLEVQIRRHQHGRADLQQLDHGAGDPRRADRQEEGPRSSSG